VKNPLHSTLREVTGPTVQRLGYWVSAIELTTDPRGLLVRLFIDGPGGVGIADCAKVTRELSPVLDVEDPIPDNYVLEVSSPGIDRLIERPEDFVRFAGFNIRVKLFDSADDDSYSDEGSTTRRKRFSGELAGMEDDRVLLRAGDTLHRIPLADVATARLNPSPEDYDRLRDVSLAPEGESR
jgi:ribosome maturation factor RimP